MNKYSDATIAKMREIGNFDYASAQKFADENGLTVRSVIAKVGALGLNYTKKDGKSPTRKSNANTRSKADIVASIERHVGAELASLSKMTVADLESLEVAVA
jgi:hypothetical protein